ncbi:lipopolysaccharide biosynthesis protein [Pseudomonas asplenii]|uniref:lipopolysaccharide biosynthesis protein n=1 Tax=Pseudomonas asplenii TaxID=53407 RepID=UPI0006B4C4C1|nr:oligosaccharide flippase family protein [Pseudomonas fuscovaginae]KPA96679.1 membrane protein involved in the export of O-antigen and teichoic acid [Pseudomonas fuscovaginae]
MSPFRKLFGSVVSYASANVINSAIPFFLLPVLTRVLSPGEYGIVAMLTTVMSVLSAFTGLSLHGAVSVRYFDRETNHPRFLGTSLAVLSGSTLLTLLVVFFVSSPLSRWVNLPVEWLLVAVLASAAQTIMQIRLVVWQVKNQVLRYGIFQISQTLFNLSLSLGLVLVLGMGWEGRGLGLVSAVFLFGLLALYSLQRAGGIDWRFDIEYAKAALRFGGPLIPHAIGGMMIAMSDRFIITSVLGVTATGSYAVGAQMGMVVGILVDAIVKAFGPHLLSELQGRDRDSGIRIVRQCWVSFLFFLILAISYVSLLPYVYPWIVGREYGDSLKAAQLIGFGNAFMGMYYVVVGFVFFAERTAYLAKLTFCIGVFNVILTVFLVNRLGVIGAAWSYVLVQMAFFFGAWYIAQKILPLPWFSALLENKSP